mmetsp:Transcript_29058/g.67993  ORF Transcript_29058/g.67993 Transcript_29058/m.67993 type:complete len:321 (+) Transcript_29058:1849-2811(+)
MAADSAANATFFSSWPGGLISSRAITFSVPICTTWRLLCRMSLGAIACSWSILPVACENEQNACMMSVESPGTSFTCSGQDVHNLVALLLAVLKLHQQLARLGLFHPLEVLDAVVAVVHVEVGDACTAVEHGKLACVDRDDAAAGQLAAHEHQVVVDTLDVAVVLVRRALGEGLRVRVACWRLAVEERELLQELVFNVRACAVPLEVHQGRGEFVPVHLVILLLTLLAGALLRWHRAPLHTSRDGQDGYYYPGVILSRNPKISSGGPRRARASKTDAILEGKRAHGSAPTPRTPHLPARHAQHRTLDHNARHTTITFAQG